MNTSGPWPLNTSRAAADTRSAVSPFTIPSNSAKSSAGVVNTSLSSSVPTMASASCGVRRVAAPATADCSWARDSMTSRSSSSWRTPYCTSLRCSWSAATRAVRH